MTAALITAPSALVLQTARAAELSGRLFALNAGLTALSKGSDFTQAFTGNIRNLAIGSTKSRFATLGGIAAIPFLLQIPVIGQTLAALTPFIGIGVQAAHAQSFKRRIRENAERAARNLAPLGLPAPLLRSAVHNETLRLSEDRVPSFGGVRRAPLSFRDPRFIDPSSGQPVLRSLSLKGAAILFGRGPGSDELRRQHQLNANRALRSSRKALPQGSVPDLFGRKRRAA